MAERGCLESKGGGTALEPHHELCFAKCGPCENWTMKEHRRWVF